MKTNAAGLKKLYRTPAKTVQFFDLAGSLASNAQNHHVTQKRIKKPLPQQWFEVICLLMLEFTHRCWRIWHYAR